jgi:hypothetical protein
MNSRRVLIVCGVALTCVLAAMSLPVRAGALGDATAALPDIAPPASGQAFWIARSMRLNGVPMTMKSFSASTNASEALNHYERDLRLSSDQSTRRTKSGVWQVLSVSAPTYFVTIRARDTLHGTEGTIAVSRPLQQARASHDTRFPHPDIARVVNLQQYDDDGIEAEHISLVSTRSVSMLARDFAVVLKREGWELLRSEASARRGGYVIEAQKAAALAFIHIQRRERGGDSSIMVVWRKA